MKTGVVVVVLSLSKLGVELATPHRGDPECGGLVAVAEVVGDVERRSHRAAGVHRLNTSEKP